MPPSTPFSLEQTWPRLNQPQVRQLAWCCFGPVLVSQWPAGIESRINLFDRWAHAWLLELEHNPQPLLAHLQAVKNPRLGFLYEAFWQFYLQQNPATELLAADLAIHQQGSTLGAFDLLFIDEQDRVVHLELALKYYLGLPWHQASDSLQAKLGAWLGPGQKDWLSRKYQHLTHKQLQLSDQTPVQAFLQDRGLPQPQIKQACLQGLLFQHWQQAQPLDQAINSDCCHNLWCRQGELIKLEVYNETDKGFLPLSQSQWLAPNQGADASWLTRVELEEFARHHFSHSPGVNRKTGEPLPSRPFQVLFGTKLDTNCELKKPQRLFICPDNWPKL